MESFSVLAGLTLMFRFCGSNGEYFLIVSPLIDNFFESMPIGSFYHKHSELSQLEMTYTCLQITEAKIIINSTPDSYISDRNRSETLFRLLNNEITGLEARNIHINYKNFTNIPAFACNFDKTIIHIIYSNYEDVCFIFAYSLEGTENAVLASYTPYLEVGLTITELINVFEKFIIDNKDFGMIRLIVLCASLFENFSPAEMKYMQYIVEEQTLEKEVYIQFINTEENLTHVLSLMCSGFIPESDYKSAQFITHYVNFYEQDKNQLIIISHNNETSVLHEKLPTQTER